MHLLLCVRMCFMYVTIIKEEACNNNPPPPQQQRGERRTPSNNMNDDARHVGLDYHSHLQRNRPNVSTPEGVGKG